MKNHLGALFPLGRELISEKLHALDLDLSPFIHRHQTGDWGDVPNCIIARNKRELGKPNKKQKYIHSRYRLPNGVMIRIQTNIQLGITCVVLDEELAPIID